MRCALLSSAVALSILLTIGGCPPASSGTNILGSTVAAQSSVFRPDSEIPAGEYKASFSISRHCPDGSASETPAALALDLGSDGTIQGNGTPFNVGVQWSFNGRTYIVRAVNVGPRAISIDLDYPDAITPGALHWVFTLQDDNSLEMHWTMLFSGATNARCSESAATVLRP